MKLPINWFDVVLVVVLVAGLFRGRKRGLSEELTTMIKWLCIVVVCTFSYEPVADFMVSQTNQFSLLFWRVTSYLTLGLVVWLIFLAINRYVGGKLLGSDVFGKSEYYLGMPAGMIRFACVLVTALALVNSRLYTEKEIKSNQAYTQDVYGSDFFPGLYELQQDVFVNSFSGRQIKTYASILLIQPTPRVVKAFKQRDYEFPK